MIRQCGRTFIIKSYSYWVGQISQASGKALDNGLDIVYPYVNLPTRSPSIQSRPLSLRLCHFGPVKGLLRVKRFTSDDDVKQYMRNWFKTQPREFYETAIHRLVSQWDKCLNIQGKYF